MEFRLTYEGLLNGASRSNSRTRHKHEIRKAFHPQLKQLWKTHPALSDSKPDGPGVVTAVPMDDFLASTHKLGNYRFVPLINDHLKLTCRLDILFLRPDPPGVLSSGDIDNRLKTLFDALRQPHTNDELGGYDQPGEDEEPFYCLLEDDSLVSQLSVDTDILLQSVDGGFSTNVARLVITVTLKPYIATYDNVSMG